MSRWSEDFRKTVSGIAVPDPEENALDSIFFTHNYLPKTDQEKQEFEEFSLITSAMALMIHIAETDKVVQALEKARIIDDMTFQLYQRPNEYNKLTTAFGGTDRTIITQVFDRLIYDYEHDTLDIYDTIRIVNMIYQNNSYLRNFLIRLCYYCAFSDKELDAKEAVRIDEIAIALHIDVTDQKRIAKEVQNEMRIA